MWEVKALSTVYNRCSILLSSELVLSVCQAVITHIIVLITPPKTADAIVCTLPFLQNTITRTS